MKNVKKLVSLLLTLVMVFSMSITVFAAENTTISAPEGSTRRYDVYQIFTGDLHEGVLSDVKWGQNGTGTEGQKVDQSILDALTAVNSKTDAEKLAEIEKYANLESTAIGTVSNGNPLTVPTGYYLIKDNGPVGEGESYSLYVVQVVGPTTISPKTSTVTSEKKVKDTNDSVSDSTTDWQDSADYDIGDKVPFQLKGTVAANYDKYKVYKFTFHDKESAGLTFDSDSVKVYVDGAEITTDFTVVTEKEKLTDDCTFEVVFSDLKQIKSVHAGSVITVEYESTLNNKAAIGSTGNPNTMHLEYSNNPNDEQGGETGNTPDDTVIVFTYKTIVNKIDPDKKPLTGAAFKLEKEVNGTWIRIKEFTVDEADPASSFEFTGLDDGKYKLTETVTPAGYNTIAPIEFTITAEHDVQSDNPALTSLNGNAATGELTFTSDANAGSLTTSVMNQKGSTLPSTGGMGTTLFYVIGGILVAGAAVLMVAKKRMSVEK